MHGVALTLACLLTAAWSGLVAWQAASGTPSPALTGAFEILRNAAWSYFPIVLLGHYQQAGSPLPFRLRPSLLFVCGFYLLFLLVTALGWWDLELVSDFGLMPSVA